MKNTLETRVGVFIAFIAIAAVLIIEILGGMGQFRGGRKVYALFNTVQELKVSDRVKMAGVEVGRVEAIEITNNAVRVTMVLRKDAQVRTDSIASIRFAGLLGQNFVSLTFGSPGKPLAAEGTVLSTEETPDLGAIMTKLDHVAGSVENLTKGFAGDEIEQMMSVFGVARDLLQNQDLTNTLANIASISGQIRSGQGTVGKLIYDQSLHDSAQSTLAELQKAVADIQITIADARSVVEDVKAGRGTVGRLVTDETLYTEATESMTNLKEILQKVNRGEGSVGKLINEQEFYNNAKLTLQKVEKSVESLEDTGPLSVLGIAVGSLF